MVGILIVSHGELVNGLLDSLSMFFGSAELAQIEGLTLLQSDDACQFGRRIDEKIRKLDTGDGVLILADMMGGTPCNQALMRLSEKVRVLAGMNLPMLMEMVYERQYGNLNLDTILETGRQGIVNAGMKILETSQSVDDD